MNMQHTPTYLNYLLILPSLLPFESFSCGWGWIDVPDVPIGNTTCAEKE